MEEGGAVMLCGRERHKEPGDAASGESSLFQMPCSWWVLGGREAGGEEFSGRDSGGEEEVSILRGVLLQVVP